MMLAAHHDFETASACDLRKAGVHKYAEHPSTRIWCMSWWFAGTYQMNRWWPGAPDPVPLLEHVARGGTMGVHNAIFERTIWNVLIRGRLCPHWPELRAAQQDCTMARAASVSIPQSLEVVAQVTGATAAKDMEGNALMRKMARPRKIHPDGRLEWWDSPENLWRVMSYCDQDVVTETEIDGLLPPLSPAERAVWVWDQTVNDRGIKLDVETIKHAIEVREIAKRRLNARMAEVTGGAVQKCTEVAKIVAWVRAQGVECESVAKGDQAEILLRADAEHLPHVREVIELRQEASKTSTAKLDAMLACACADGRARGLLHYHGASSGRWAGRLIQPQNLYRVDPERDGDSIQRTVDILLAHEPQAAHDTIAMLLSPPSRPEMIAHHAKARTAFGAPMTMLAKSLRTMIVAEEGNTLHGVDLANIEGRLQAWISGEEWKLDAFRAYDAGTGPDLYCVAYGKAFAEDPAAVKKQAEKRQIGKVMELALGYQGSVGSFISMGRNYGLQPGPLVPVIQQVAPERWAQWCGRYAGARDKRGLPRDQWAAVKTIVQGWREQHANIVQAWWDLQDAAIEAVAAPGQVVPLLDGKVAYYATRSFLYGRLPSGRVLAYCNPRVVQAREEWFEMPDGEVIDCAGFTPFDYDLHRALGGVQKERLRRRVDYEGFDGEKRKWGTFSLYGGMQFNHFVQGAARDVLVDGALRAESRGYPIVLHVHDEVLAETPDWFGAAEELEAIMTEGAAWLHGCPLAAKGWSGVRYAK